MFPLPGALQPTSAMLYAFDLKAFLMQVLREHLAKLCVVIDDQNLVQHCEYYKNCGTLSVPSPSSLPFFTSQMHLLRAILSRKWSYQLARSTVRTPSSGNSWG